MAIIKYKGSDGTYKTLNNYNVKNVPIVQTSGDSTESVMSQKAVTDELNTKADASELETLKTTVENDYAQKSELEPLAKTAEVSSTYATKTEVTTKIATATEDMATNTDINAKIVPVSESCIESTFVPSKNTVDLGLPSGLLWATCNLGANSPTEYGLYFAWGETEGYVAADEKGEFSWGTYKFGGSDTNNSQSKYNSTDGLTTLEPQDDAVTVMLGRSWRIPTEAEVQELIDNTTNSWVEDYQGSGVNGRLFKGKGEYADKELFLPACGYVTSLGTSEDSSGRYWSSSLSTSFRYNGRNLFFSSSSPYMISAMRSFGCPLRPVLPE